MVSIDLQWLEFPINLNMVESWMRANAGSSYCGNSSDRDLTLWFKEEPGESVREAIQSYWSGMTSMSPEAVGYKTAAQEKADAASAKASALASAAAKLKSLGLTDAEIAAMQG